MKQITLFALALVLISAYLLKATPPTPVVFFTDIESGPAVGGESVNGFAGSYVTLYGANFGTTGTVTLGGIDCLRVLPAIGNYTGYGSTYLWYQKIIVQLGPACPAGASNFVVTSGGQASNAIPFTVRAGHIFFASTTGNDNNSGSSASPFRLIGTCNFALSPGDICYVRNGVTQTTNDNFGAAISQEKTGSAGNPVALVAAPGAIATIGSASLQYGLRVPDTGQSANYVTIAGLYFNFSDMAIDPNNSHDWRIVGNNFQCPTSDQPFGCAETNNTQFVKVLGNELTNIGAMPMAQKQQHALYFSTDSNHIEAAWNSIHDNRSCRAIQFHSSPVDSGSGNNQFDLSIHDNLIYNDPCDGIELATVDPSKGAVRVFNNVVHDVGRGPDPSDTESGDYSCFRAEGGTNNGPLGSGTIQVMNNSFTNCGHHHGTFNKDGAIVLDGLNLNLKINLIGNVITQQAGDFYGNGPGFPSLCLDGGGNVWSGNGPGPFANPTPTPTPSPTPLPTPTPTPLPTPTPIPTPTPTPTPVSEPVISTVIAAATIVTVNIHVQWVTDEATQAQVEFGPTIAYGSLTPLTTAGNWNIRTTPGVYHYRIRATDAQGRLSLSPDFTITAN